MYRILLILFLCTLTGSCATYRSKNEKIETTVCGMFKEPFVFWLWNRSAGLPDPLRLEGFHGAAAISYTTSDGRVLNGYHLKSTSSDSVKHGSVLVAQGNAMLADRLLTMFSDLTNAGLDVYVFDYRGYGRSGGNRRLKAIVNDYRELFANVIRPEGGRHYLYGISFGGIIVSNVIGSGATFDRAVVDSSPSRLSPHGCAKEYDPVENMPQDASRIFVLAGQDDKLIRPSDSEELRTIVHLRGGKALLSADFGHPFMDTGQAIQRERMTLIRNYLIDPINSSTNNGQ